MLRSGRIRKKGKSGKSHYVGFRVNDFRSLGLFNKVAEIGMSGYGTQFSNSVDKVKKNDLDHFKPKSGSSGGSG